MVSKFHKLSLSFEMESPFVQTVYRDQDLLAMNRVYTLAFGKLAGFLCHRQVPSFREEAEYAAYGAF